MEQSRSAASVSPLQAPAVARCRPRQTRRERSQDPDGIPIHQVDHNEENALHGAVPVMHRVATPRVALLMVLKHAASRKSEATSCSRRIAG